MSTLAAHLVVLLSVVYYAESEFICSSEDGSLVNTTFGCSRGNVITNDTYAYVAHTAIPFARKPIGDLRFSNPVKIQQGDDYWMNITDGNGVIDATNIPNACYQQCPRESITCYKNYANMSEDCLYLNIYMPSTTLFETNATEDYTNLPVLFFIHGGSYLDGWSGSQLYNGGFIAYNNKVIVVTINYRLGSFGFLYHEDSDGSNVFEGNYGYQDQLMALQWVNDHIEGYGGSPDHIIIFGESAGAISVGTLLIGEQDSGLYHGAIMQSNPLGLSFHTSESWDYVSSVYINNVSCSGDIDIATCMRNVKADELLTAQQAVEAYLTKQCTCGSIRGLQHGHCDLLRVGTPWTPTIKPGTIFEEQPLFAFANGNFNKKVPIIIGTNQNEGVPFLYTAILKLCTAECKKDEGAKYCPSESGECKDMYEDLLEAIFGSGLESSTVEKYKSEDPSCYDGDYRNLNSKITTDALFACPTKNVSLSISKHSTNKIYLYYYNYDFTDSRIYYPSTPICGEEDIVCHGDELPIVFHPTLFTYDALDNYMSAAIGVYWTNLAKQGYPGHGIHNMDWVEFNDEDLISMIFHENGSYSLQHNYDVNQCEFWDAHDYAWLNYKTTPCSSEVDEISFICHHYFSCSTEKCDDELFFTTQFFSTYEDDKTTTTKNVDIAIHSTIFLYFNVFLVLHVIIVI